VLNAAGVPVFAVLVLQVETVGGSFEVVPVDGSFAAVPVGGSSAVEPVGGSFEAGLADGSFVVEPVGGSFADEPVDDLAVAYAARYSAGYSYVLVRCYALVLTDVWQGQHCDLVLSYVQQEKMNVRLVQMSGQQQDVPPLRNAGHLVYS
jgi:hypothetical protein